jgi:phosphonate transport system substrate-binding protein
MGDRLIAVACDQNMDGSNGYHSVIVVRADSPYHTVDDLKGKTLSYADPNSTSGYAAPVYYLTKEGKPPASFFGKTLFGGSHELEVIALMNGTFDAAADDWYSETSSNALRMEEKGLIPRNSTRIVWKSPLIPNPPYVVRTNLPAELRKIYVEALLALPADDPQAYRDMAENRSRAIIPMKHEDYLEIIDITLQNAKARKAG